MSKLDELKRLEAGATVGPWEYSDGIVDPGYRPPYQDSPPGIKTHQWVDMHGIKDIDGQFIAASRNALPALLRVVEAAREYYMARSCYTDGAVKDRLRDALRELEGE